MQWRIPEWAARREAATWVRQIAGHPWELRVCASAGEVHVSLEMLDAEGAERCRCRCGCLLGWPFRAMNVGD